MIGYLKLTNNLTVPVDSISLNYIVPDGSFGANDCMIILNDSVNTTQLNTSLQALLNTTIPSIALYAQQNDPDPIWSATVNLKVNTLVEQLEHNNDQGVSITKTLGLSLC